MPKSEVPRLIEFLVPGDPGQNTGGYRYVRELVGALNKQGYTARITGLEGQFPRPDKVARGTMDETLSGMEDGACVVLDGLAMGGLPEVIEKHSARLNLLALVHHPLAAETGISEEYRRWFFESEKRALQFVRGVLTTSRHTASRLADYDVPDDIIKVAEPGVTRVTTTRARSAGLINACPHILCVAHLSPRKAQHQLVEALGRLKALPWQCTLAGSTTRDPDYSKQVQRAITEAGLDNRIEMVGEVEEAGLAELYLGADFFVLPSLYEGYGMVIDEALAEGLPIISSNGGALASTSARPGIVQYCAGDVSALTARIANWLEHPEQYARSLKLAEEQSGRIRSWDDTAGDVFEALRHFTSAIPEMHQHSAFESDWLAAREPADHSARSRILTSQLNRWLVENYDSRGREIHRPMQIVDIGTGRGSNALYLVPALQVPQSWLALDQDADLLHEASQRLEKSDVPFTTNKVQLTPENIEQHLPREVSLITASALIDLVSEPWLSALCAAAVRRNSAVLIVLSYAGDFELRPGHPADDLLRNLVNQHQHGDKGTGAALGPEAPALMKQLLVSKGYRVELAESPWTLDSQDRTLIQMLMQGWAEAAIEQSPEEQDCLTDWLQAREKHLSAGELTVLVRHLDLLAVPSGEHN